MKIGMILDDVFPPHPRVKNEAINLMEAGHEVVLFCLNYNNSPKNEIIDGISIVRYTSGKYLRSLSSLAYTFFLYRWILQKKIKKFISEFKPDALHIHNMRSGNAAFKATKNFNGKIILDLHENIPEIMKMYHHVTHFPGNILIYPSRWKTWERILVNKSDKIIVVTEEAKQDLIINYKLAEKKIIVVPNSVQPSFYTNPKIDVKIVKRFKENFSLFYFGDTGTRRGIETAIKSVDILKDKIPNILLTIVGRSKSDAYLKNLAKQINIEKHIAFEGFQDESLVQSYIASSDICISPLLRNIHHDTTFANKIFQYMALSKPLVVSDCTAQKRIIEEAQSGLVHVAGNAHDLSEKIFTLHQNKSMRKKLGSNGALFIREEYNQVLQSQDLVQYYNSLNP